jgi:hypothetical protein
LIKIAGVAPVTQRLGLFFKNKLYFSSGKITRTALVFLAAFLLIIGAKRILQMD